METHPTPPKKVHRYPCPSCGADLLYEPRDGFLSCRYCGHKEAIPTSAEQVEERSFEQYLQMRPEQLELLAANALEVQCQSCGATVTFTPPEVARQCDFCGVQIVAQPKSADPMLAPECVLPFLPYARAGRRGPQSMAQVEVVRTECAKALCQTRFHTRRLFAVLDLRHKHDESLRGRARRVLLRL